MSIALFCVAALLLFVGMDAWHRYDAYGDRQQLYSEELSQLRWAYHEQSAYLSRMLEDPVFFEHVVRQRLGFSKDGEMVLRFH
jgi:hypothetical protein